MTIPMVRGDAGAPPSPPSPQDQSAIHTALKGDDTPVHIPELPNDEVTLGAGYLTPQGALVQLAQVRQMNGEDEEAIAKAGAARNSVRFIDTLVRRCTLRVGDIDTQENPRVLDELLIGDRDLLVLTIRRITFGDEVELSELTCPNCGNKFSVLYDLSKDVPIRHLEDAFQLLHGSEVKLRKGRATVRLIDGATQKLVYGNETTLTVPEMNTVLLRNCVQQINGEPVVSLDQIRLLGSGDRKLVMKFLTENQPGPRYEEVKQECNGCGRSFPLVIDLPTLFLS